MDRFLTQNENPTSFLAHMESHGLVQDKTPKLGEYLKTCADGGFTPRAYIGFDPSAESLQIGNLMQALVLRRAQLHGVQPYLLLGGATGLIGDPSGKKEERNLMDKNLAAANTEKFRAQLAKLVDTDAGKFQAKFVNNLDWFQDFRFLDFLRDVGRYVTVNYMTAKDSVKIRMETGISYAEFGYMLVQGYDFLHLFEKENCAIQMGGSDQWGNMTTGLELIRRKHGKEAHVLCTPLLTDAAGNKLGKSEKGTIFLDPKLTPPFRFYQYWLGQADADIGKLLHFLTLFRTEYIQDLVQQAEKQPEARAGQKVLAHEMTRMVHGEEAALASENASRVLFSKDPKMLESLGAKGLELLAQEVPSSRFTGDSGILDLLVATGLCASKGEARRHLKSGAVSLNREKLTDENAKVTGDNFGGRKFLLLGVGKANLHLVLKD